MRKTYRTTVKFADAGNTLACTIAKAPAALVEQEKTKLALNQQKLEQVEKRLAELKESL